MVVTVQLLSFLVLRDYATVLRDPYLGDAVNRNVILH